MTTPAHDLEPGRNDGGKEPTDPEADEVHRITSRAIRRLDILEYVILAGAAILALVAGALVAFLAGEALDLPFRTVWVVASLLLFVVPASWAWWSERRGGGQTVTGTQENPGDAASPSEQGRNEHG